MVSDYIFLVSRYFYFLFGIELFLTSNVQDVEAQKTRTGSSQEEWDLNAKQQCAESRYSRKKRKKTSRYLKIRECQNTLYPGHGQNAKTMVLAFGFSFPFSSGFQGKVALVSKEKVVLVFGFQFFCPSEGVRVFSPPLRKDAPSFSGYPFKLP